MLLTPPPVTNCHTFSDPLLPSSVTYFMDGPIGLHRLHTPQLDLLLTLYTRVIASRSTATKFILMALAIHTANLVVYEICN